MKIIGAIWSKIYQSQVKLTFSKKIAHDLYQNVPSHGDFFVTSCETEEHVAKWAGILNKDLGFGTWTPDRVRTELLARLVTPDSSTLIFDGNELIGCACLIDWSKSRRIAAGMYMILESKYRGKSNLSYILTFRTLNYLAKTSEYDRTLIATDPDRKSALLIYLRYGARPLYDSLYSYVQWYRIRRRLRPTIRKLEARSQGVRLGAGRVGSTGEGAD